MSSNPRNVSGGVFVRSDETFRITVKPQGVRFLSRGVQPPSAIYVEAEDDLAVSVASSVANETVTFNYRLLRFDGEIIEGQFTVSPASNRTVKKYSESLAEGFLLSMSCQAAAATTRGQTFVRVALTSPAFTGNLPSYMLMADYVTTAMAPAHPNGRVLSPVEGPGRRYAILTPVIGPGIEWSVVVPANARWRIDSVFVAFQASAVVANRQIGAQMSIAGTTAYSAGAEVNTTASQNPIVEYSKTRFVPINAAKHQWVALPQDVVLLPNDVLQSITVALDPGDQYAQAQVAVEEWLDNV